MKLFVVFAQLHITLQQQKHLTQRLMLNQLVLQKNLEN